MSPKPAAVRGLAFNPTLRFHLMLELMAQGLTDAEIGKHLELATATIKTNVQTLLKQYGARNRTHAVTIAYQRGILAAHTHEGTPAP